LLERLPIGEASRHLADQEDDRRRVLRGGVDADRSVGRARAAGDQRDAGAAGELAVGVGHVRGATLVPADDEPDPVARVVEPVQDGQVALARDAEDVVDALGQKALDQDLAAGAGECRRTSHRGYLYATALAVTCAASNWFISSTSSLVTSSAAGTLAGI